MGWNSRDYFYSYLKGLCEYFEHLFMWVYRRGGIRAAYVVCLVILIHVAFRFSSLQHCDGSIFERCFKLRKLHDTIRGHILRRSAEQVRRICCMLTKSITSLFTLYIPLVLCHRINYTNRWYHEGLVISPNLGICSSVTCALVCRKIIQAHRVVTRNIKVTWYRVLTFNNSWNISCMICNYYQLGTMIFLLQFKLAICLGPILRYFRYA